MQAKGFPSAPRKAEDVLGESQEFLSEFEQAVFEPTRWPSWVDVSSAVSVGELCSVEVVSILRLVDHL